MSKDNEKNGKIDLEEFIEFFLLDSQEQVDKLGSGLIQLEKDGENVALVNELFRSVHSLKGASGTMGFTPIVELAHAAEDLFDKLRQGKMLVSNEIIDVLLAVTDKIRAMLTQVEQRVEINEEYAELTLQMKTIVETGAVAEQSLPSSRKTKNEKKFDSKADFLLNAAQRDMIDEALFTGKAVYQVEVTLTPDTLMKAVRAVMVVQRLEPLGSVVTIEPSIEEIESGKIESFNLLFVSIEPTEEIRADILEVSEIKDVKIIHYSLSDSPLSNLTIASEESSRKIAGAANETDRPDLTANKMESQKVSDQSQESGNAQVHTIRVETIRMDNLINLIGEMVITRTQLVKLGNDLSAKYQSDSLVSSLNEANNYLGRLMGNMQESIMRLRMVPVGTVFSRYPRVVRDFCRKSGKKIELVINGEETELDKTVIELIGDPLMHIIRNSVDHGIESPEHRKASGKPEMGTITLDAYHEGNHIAILVSDDGAGLNFEKIQKKALEKGLIGQKEEMAERDIANLIFLPGFSTAEKVTDISGRGVGMDVVKKALNSLGGLIDIRSKKGEGTTFIIRLPLTLAIIQALLVEVSEETYAIPLASVIETLLVKKNEIKTVGGLPMVQLRGNTLPLLSLRQQFDLSDSDSQKDEVYVVVVGLGDKVIGLVVDELQGQQEIVIKTLGDYLNNLQGIAGATILGDGKVTLILDIASLVQNVLVAAG